MSDNLDADSLRAILDKLDNAAHGDSPVVFDQHEAEALQRFAKVWIGFEGMALLGGALGSAVKWFLLIIGAVIATKAGFLDWVSGAVSK